MRNKMRKQKQHSVWKFFLLTCIGVLGILGLAGCGKTKEEGLATEAAVVEDELIEDLETFETSFVREKDSSSGRIENCFSHIAMMDAGKYTDQSWNSFLDMVEQVVEIYDQNADDEMCDDLVLQLQTQKCKLEFRPSGEDDAALEYHSYDAKDFEEQVKCVIQSDDFLHVSLDNYDQIHWYKDRRTKQMLEKAKRLGFDTVRIAVEVCKEPLEDGYLNSLQDLTDFCLENDMQVILALSDYKKEWLSLDIEKMDETYEIYEEAWRVLANCFRDYDERVIFESNEKRISSAQNTTTQFEKQTRKNINQLFINIVRATGSNNRNRMLILRNCTANEELESYENSQSGNVFLVKSSQYDYVTYGEDTAVTKLSLYIEDRGKKVAKDVVSEDQKKAELENNSEKNDGNEKEDQETEGEKKETVESKSDFSEMFSNNIVLEKTAYEVDMDSYFYINAKNEDKNGKLTYQSLDPEVVHVNQLGKCVGLREGITEIVICDGVRECVTVSVQVNQGVHRDVLRVACNVLFNDEEKEYSGNEVGECVEITEDGTYEVSFDVNQNLSEEAMDASIDAIENLTAIYLKDYDVTLGNQKQSFLKSCNIKYEQIVLDDEELVIVQKKSQNAIKDSKIFDTNGPLNAWGECIVVGVEKKNRVMNFYQTKPQRITIIFTISNLQFEK